MKPEEFARALLSHRVVVCVGCGGVGKTTVAAALGLEAARRGRRALVLTIDPARRLADALGVEALGNQPRALPRERLAALGIPAEGELSALMLDMKRTFDDLVERFSDDPDTRERILENPIYRHVSETLAGSVEFAAMEKVYELWERDEHDLLVLDTPPARHALEFLDAPQRLMEFLESPVVQRLIHPAFAAGRFGVRLFQQGTRRVLQLMERLTGMAFLEDVSEFLLIFEEMSSGFRQRATRVRGLLLGPESCFVLVTGPGRESLEHATRLHERLRDYGVELAGVVANRVRLWPDALPPPTGEPRPEDLAALEEALASAGSERPREAATAAIAAAKGYAALVRRDERTTRALREAVRAQGRFWGPVPELPVDVHDLDGLARVAEALFRVEEPPLGQGP